MGSIAVGFGTMLAAPSKALYAVAVQKRKGADGETSSIASGKSAEFDSQPIRKGFLRKATSMQRSLSDQSSGSSIDPLSKRSETIQRQFNKDVGSKGIGRILKATVEGKNPTM
jgi:hypothetical protein